MKKIYYIPVMKKIEMPVLQFDGLDRRSVWYFILFYHHLDYHKTRTAHGVYYDLDI